MPTQIFSTVGGATFTVPEGVSTVQVIIVGGGGGGGRSYGGGGGGGGVISNTAYAVAAGAAIAVSVGSGGLGSTTDAANGGSGGNSIFGSLTAVGGGGGGSNNAAPGSNGGSGGGGGGLNGTAGGSGTSGQGHAGGGGNNGDDPDAGGGGGYSGGGGTGSGEGVAGGGGAGFLFTDGKYYGAGGGGASYITGGGPGSPGAGAGGSGTAGSSASANTGSGGGGGANGLNGGNGGSGFVQVTWNTLSFLNLASLRAYNPLLLDSTVTIVSTAGFSTVGDGGGGTFVWVANDNYSFDNGGTLIVPSGTPPVVNSQGNVITPGTAASTGCWHMIIAGTQGNSILPSTTLDVRWFGAIPNQTDSTPGCRLAYSALSENGAGQGLGLSGTLRFPAGQYSFVTKWTVDMTAHQNYPVSIIGDGDGGTEFMYAMPGADSCMIEIRGGSVGGSMQNIGLRFITGRANSSVIWIYGTTQFSLLNIKASGLRFQRRFRWHIQDWSILPWQLGERHSVQTGRYCRLRWNILYLLDCDFRHHCASQRRSALDFMWNRKYRFHNDWLRGHSGIRISALLGWKHIGNMLEQHLHQPTARSGCSCMGLGVGLRLWSICVVQFPNLHVPQYNCERYSRAAK